MAKIPEKTEGNVGAAAEGVKDAAQQKLDEAKKKLGFGAMFKKLLDDLKAGKGKEALKSLTALIVAAFTGKLANLKSDVEKTRKDKRGKGKETKPEKKDKKKIEKDNAKKADEAPANDNELPAGLEEKNGKPLYNKENILKCDNIRQCRQLMKLNGYYLDETGNYVNPHWLSAEKRIPSKLVNGKIGNQTIRLKERVMNHLQEADRLMFAETGEHIKVGEHFRSNERQFELYKKLKPQGARVAPPGSSFHELGQAVDLPLNWEKAQTYMWKVGFRGGKAGLSGDFNHFSMGHIKPEIRMTEKRRLAMKEEGVELSEHKKDKAS